MEAKDVIQLVAILITLALGVWNLVFSLSEAKKNRRASLVSERRRARMEQFATLFARVEALAHPDTILHAAGRSETPYHISITESCSALKMLFDHRYERDALLAREVMEVSRDAIGFYRHCTGPGDCAAAKAEYEARYRENIRRLEGLINVYMGAEWTRLQRESETGRKVPYEEWERLYAEGLDYYGRWRPDEPGDDPG